MLANKTIVLGVTGGIAAYKSAEIASKLTQAGAQVNVVMTESATRFIVPLTFRSITGRPVVTDMFELASEFNIEHVALGEEADVVVIAPATANTIARLAAGLADNILCCTVLATKAPVIIAPAMNDNMYLNPITQENIAKLKARGFKTVDPEYGRLASGKMGWGRMAEVDKIIGTIQQVLGRSGDLAGKHIVVSAGGTQEPIDPVRHIGNRSSGKMGYAIAEAARDRGAIVSLITAPTSLPEPAGIEVIHVTTAAEMKKAVADATAQADALIMAAAVADYQPKTVAKAKIKKDAPGLTLELVRTPDILTEVSGKFLKVGFAAESENMIENARQKLEKKQLDIIVANDITDADSGFGADANKVTIIDRDGNVESLPLMSKREVADRILDRVAGRLGGKPRRYIEIKLKDGYIERHCIAVPKKYHYLFPEFKTPFTLITNAGDIETTAGLVQSGSGQSLELRKGLNKWYKKNPQLKEGDWVRISEVNPMKKYQLEVLEQ